MRDHSKIRRGPYVIIIPLTHIKLIVLRIVKNLDKLHNVRVVKFLHYSDLAIHLQRYTSFVASGSRTLRETYSASYNCGFKHPFALYSPFDYTTFVLEVLSVHGNDLHLFGVKAFPLL